MILMRQNLINVSGMTEITYLVGNETILANMPMVHALTPFSDNVIEFLNLVSRKLLSDSEAKAYPDIITLGFWIRRSSVEKLKSRFMEETNHIIQMGRGIAFHIAPSNVPVNYAYSLVTGLLTGNANVVRVPSKDFSQVNIINRILTEALTELPGLASYICLIRYGHNQEVNDAISAEADIRIVWGGDSTIAELRKSPMKPRASEITFADRFSICVIDSNAYDLENNKQQIANDFYNDTYLTDQNACTSPRIVIWMGSRTKEAKESFWSELHKVVEKKYPFQPIQGVNKLTSAYLISAYKAGVHIKKSPDNLITRIDLEALDDMLMDFKDNSGFFFEYCCEDIMDLSVLCDDTRCQTIAYIGKSDMLIPLIKQGIKGIDRIVPLGRTMDFDLIWDGYDLFERMTRVISIM